MLANFEAASGYDPFASLTIELENLKIKAEDGGSVANSAMGVGYAGNPFQSTTEDDEWLASMEMAIMEAVSAEEYLAMEAAKKGEVSEKSVKDNYKQFLDKPNFVNGMKTVNALGLKGADFAKSSFHALNELPANARKQGVQKMINDAVGNPKTMGQSLKSFAAKAGKGAGIAALTVACLPAGVGALIASGKASQSDRKQALEDLERELMRIDTRLDSGDLDADTKADLLIAKRAAENAINKLKYNLDTRGVRNN